MDDKPSFDPPLGLGFTDSSQTSFCPALGIFPSDSFLPFLNERIFLEMNEGSLNDHKSGVSSPFVGSFPPPGSPPHSPPVFSNSFLASFLCLRLPRRGRDSPPPAASNTAISFSSSVPIPRQPRSPVPPFSGPFLCNPPFFIYFVPLSFKPKIRFVSGKSTT